jgi:2-oxo-4-hydroxy-4-carboxy-5-ureidoimidazoline decarboxylase
MSEPRLSIAAVNAMGRAQFVSRFGAVYEKSPWVAEAAWNARPFTDPAALEHALAEAVRKANHAQQLELLHNHPRLGTRLALSGYSHSEQARAGLLAASDAERTQLAQLNEAYEAKFGFPFILAVRNANARSILDSCRTRINHDAQSEFDESLRQVFKIAHFRLSDLMDNGRSATR